ncbi:MAG: HAD family hydrolase [Myxococcales bacterium]|nr:HAD family hydrolase [Myxococcales bacterium]
MAVRCVVLDFDGTFTDVETESAPFRAYFQSLMADLLGRDLRAEWEREERRIVERPEVHGWEFDGRVVAPSTADPYLLTTATVQGIFDAGALLRNPLLRTAISQTLYGLAYERTLTAFKPDARETLERLVAVGLPVYVVTNSRTDVVSHKLDQLGLTQRARVKVMGEAKKFWVTPSTRPAAQFAMLPEFEAAPIARPVYLRRGRYYDALAAIWEATNTLPEETLVCGDIYELDLALPAALGCKVALTESKRTLEFERALTRRHNGHVLGALSELLTLV